MTELVTIPSESTFLHGVIHLPGRGLGRPAGILISCSNIGPKFGPHRLFFRAAEAMADAGFYVLRYDNRGTCDSPGRCELTFAHRVTDARAALAYFRTRYRLETVVGWGLCMAAAVLVHCTTSPFPEERLDGLVLSNILAHPSDGWLPEFGEKVDVREMFLGGNVMRKVGQLLRNFHAFRRNLPGLAAKVFKRHWKPQLELVRLHSALDRVGKLLAEYSGPCLLVFGEKDPLRKRFFEQVNPGDRLRLAKKRVPPDWAVINDGDHALASREQTADLIHCTLRWLERFRQEHQPTLPIPS